MKEINCLSSLKRKNNDMQFNSKKGQAEHAFAFIIFILVAAFVLILGYKGISSLISDSCDLEDLKFEETVVGLIERYDDYGSLHKDSIRLPCEATHICFVDKEVYGVGINTPPTGSTNDIYLDHQKVFESAVEAKVNIFLVGEFTTPVGYSDKIEIDGDVLCVEARGRVANLVFKGNGKTTIIEEG